MDMGDFLYLRIYININICNEEDYPFFSMFLFADRLHVKDVQKLK